MKSHQGRKLGSIGDVDPTDYGGGVVFSTEHGPTLEYVEEHMHGADPEARLVYRVDLHDNAREFLDWFDWVDWDEVAQTVGADPSEFSASRLRSATARALAVESAAGQYGWYEMDSYPATFSDREIEIRWRLV